MYYKIKNITDLNGVKRTEGRYPLRIGRIIDGEESIIQVGSPAFLVYMTDEKGDMLVGKCLRTSTVQDMYINYENMDIEFKTLNSIYSLELI